MNDNQDKMLRTMFRVPSLFKDMFASLSPEIKYEMDIDSFEYVDQSFADDQMKGSWTDIVYRANRNDGQKVLVCLLFLFKALSNDGITSSVLRYVGEVRNWQADSGEDLLPITPIVIYTGDKKDFQKLK